MATGTSAIERLLRLAVDLLDVVAETSAIERPLRLAVELLRCCQTVFGRIDEKMHLR